MRELNADLVDEHYYRPPEWFLNNVNRYDQYDRTGPKVFAGEYAAHTATRRNSLAAALAEAAFMTGIERNSDVVVMASYAPLFAKVGFTQQPIDLIWFDNTRLYGSPSYYVQQLFSLNRGDTVLPLELADSRLPQPSSRSIISNTLQTDVEFKDTRDAKGSSITATRTPDLFATASQKDGKVIIKAVNPTSQATYVTIRLSGMSRIGAKGEAIVLSGAASSDENSFEKPTKVALVTTPLSGIASKFRYKFKPYSVTVLRIDAER